MDLANSKYDRVILTVENPEEIAARLSAPPSQCRVNRHLRCDIVELRPPLSPFIAQAAGKTVDAARAQTPTWASGRYGDLDAPRSIASGHPTRLPNT